VRDIDDRFVGAVRRRCNDDRIELRYGFKALDENAEQRLPPAGMRTFPGRRLLPIRASMVATIRMIYSAASFVRASSSRWS